jgi:hypothetical protein
MKNYYAEKGPEGFLPWNLTDQQLQQYLSYTKLLETGCGPLDLLAQVLGNAALCIQGHEFEESPEKLKLLTEEHIHQMMNTFCDELIYEDLKRRKLIEKPDCVEISKFYSSTRPLLLTILKPEAWPADDQLTLQNLRRAGIKLDIETGFQL